jgi:hypothetical protein
MVYIPPLTETTGFSSYYLMHGREMVLPTTQSITAKISPELRGTIMKAT